MKLTILTENYAGSGFLAEHGLSYLIECDGQNILFDTGHTDVFLRNAHKLCLNIQDQVNTVVLSHGHWDHGDGLKYMKNKTLVTHPKSFMKRYRKVNNSYIGLNVNKMELEKKYDIIETKKYYHISDDIVFLGEIPRLNDFEAKMSAFIDQEGEADFVPDDSALAMIQDKSLIVVSGCAHAGICNTIEHAKKITGIDKVDTVVGGFHLKHNDTLTQKTIKYFKEQNIENVFPSHCTDLPALSAFYDAFGITFLKSGRILDL